MEWLISANKKKYDYDKAFKELDVIDWKQNANYSVGDIIYIYASRPISSLKYKVEVLKININRDTTIDDKKYWIDQSEYESRLNKGVFARFKLLETYLDGHITLMDLHEHGLVGNIQGPRKTVDENGVILSWAHYIHEMIIDPWNEFEKEAFSNIDYLESFKKCKIRNRNYYDIYWDNETRLHLLIRNKNNEKYLSIYVHNDRKIYEILKNSIDELNNGINDIIKVYNDAELKNLKHRQLRIDFNEMNNNFNEWVIKNAIILKRNIEQILKKGTNQIINSNKDIEHSLIDDMINVSNIGLSKFVYTDKVKLKTKPIICKGVNLYKRDKQVAINALNKAGFICEIKPEHPCFKRKDGVTPYTEAHHLIPMSLQDQFDYSLDIEENIVSLCSNCHNEIHYGVDRKELVKKLYSKRIEFLRKKNIDISLKELLEQYG